MKTKTTKTGKTNRWNTSWKDTTLAMVTLAASTLLLTANTTLAAAGAEAKVIPHADISDQDIAVALEGELARARGVDANDVDVTVHDGVVRLQGTADNILAKQRESRIASMIKGVRAVVDDVAVVSDGRTDHEISSDVQTALASDPAVNGLDISTHVDDGDVKLTGKVNSWAQRDLAATVTESVPGVRDVKNDIAVSSVRHRSDKELANEIRDRLKWDARVDDMLIKVSVSKGDVELSGTVGSAFERRQAEADAWVDGVHTVDASKLDVKWWARDEMRRKSLWTHASDKEIRHAVQESFVYDPRVMPFNPDVMVKDGAVTLRGHVDNLEAKRAAAEDASDTVGVWRVKNYLKVRPANALSDDAIADSVGNALARNVYVQRFDTDVVVDHGIVHLYGTVDSDFEKQQASNVAARVAGVVAVENHLKVEPPAPFYPSASYECNPGLYAYTVPTPSADRVTRDDIESQLFWSPFVNAKDVDVTVKNGVATLTGEVDDWREFNAATENAYEGGATRVVNDLRIERTS
jgi:osmotically-inducible protein OsmY